VPSAVFAALTAIFAKIGVEKVNSDLANFIRTVVVIVTFDFFLAVTGQFQASDKISARTYLFLLAHRGCVTFARSSSAKRRRSRRSTNCRWCWWRSSARSFSASA
jgi:uncharacterized membrane protein